MGGKRNKRTTQATDGAKIKEIYSHLHTLMKKQSFQALPKEAFSMIHKSLVELGEGEPDENKEIVIKMLQERGLIEEI